MVKRQSVPFLLAGKQEMKHQKLVLSYSDDEEM